MRLIDWLFFVTIFFLPTLSNSQIPINPNYTDTQNLRQGKWTILFDKEWEKVGSIDSTAYYRLINYKDNLPLGEVHDYFKSGKIKRVFTLLSDQPEVKLDINQPITCYFEDGTKDMAAVLSDKGNYYMDKGKLDKAVPFLSEATEVCIKKKGKENDDYLDYATDLATCYQQQGNYDKAKALYIEVKDTRAKISGKENTYYATALDNLGMLYEELEEFSAAESLLLEAKAIRERILGKENEEYASSLSNLASHYREVGKFSDSEIMFTEELKTWEQVVGKESEEYATALSNLGELYDEKGNYAKAEPMYMEAKEITARVFGKTSQQYSTILNNLASLYNDLGRYSDAEALYLESLLILEKTSGKETMDYSISLNNLATFYYERDDYVRAKKLLLSSISILEKVVGKMHSSYATSIDNLGGVYLKTGDYKNAEALMKEALNIRLKTFGKMHPAYAASLEGLGAFYLEVGNYQQATDFFGQAKTIRLKAQGKLNPDYATTLSNLALTYQNNRYFSKAEELLLEAKEIYKKTIGTDHPDYARVLEKLASVSLDLKKYSVAESYYVEANAIVAKTVGKESSDYASSLSDLGHAYEILNKDSLAESCYLEAKEIVGRILGKDHPSYSQGLYDLAFYYSSNNKDEKAESYYLELVTRTMDQIDRYFSLFSDQEKKLYNEKKQAPLTDFKLFCLDQAKKNPALLSHFYNLTLKTKGILFNSSEKMRHRIMTSKNKELIDQYKAWKSKKELLSKLYKMTAEERKQFGFSLKKTREEANEAEKKLSLWSENYSLQNENKQYTWENVRNKLKEGEVAIEIIRMKKWMTVKEGRWRHSGMMSIYVALLITPETKDHPEMILLKNGDHLENKFIRYYHNAIKELVKDTISFTQFWKPIAEKIGGASKVYLSADGVYNQLNVNTLYNSVSGKYLADETEVELVASTKDLITRAEKSHRQIKEATIFSYPNYNYSNTSKADSSRSLTFLSTHSKEELVKNTASRFLDGENIAELPGTKIEAEIIETLLHAQKIPVHEFIYDMATEEAIKNLNNPQVLHIATHGFFLTDVMIEKDNGRGLTAIDNKKIADNPLLRSGLLLAGAKNAFHKKDSILTREDAFVNEDGILTAYEVMNLALDDTDLVVMSACETGLGVITNGEGVYGLQRAFQVAGAKSVLMSLWSVSDDATQQLMVLFYQNWLGGKTPREAFRMAQLTLREKYPQPYYWGAFVLVGN